MGEEKENSKEQEERNAAVVREAWRGAWLIVLGRGAIILVAQAGFCALVFTLLYLLDGLPEWLRLVLLAVIVIPLTVLGIIVFLVFPHAMEKRVYALVDDIIEQKGISEVGRFEKVNTFGWLTSFLFVFVPGVVFCVLVDVLIF